MSPTEDPRSSCFDLLSYKDGHPLGKSPHEPDHDRPLSESLLGKRLLEQHQIGLPGPTST